jgi:hypothetical protein
MHQIGRPHQRAARRRQRKRRPSSSATCVLLELNTTGGNAGSRTRLPFVRAVFFEDGPDCGFPLLSLSGTAAGGMIRPQQRGSRFGMMYFRSYSYTHLIIWTVHTMWSPDSDTSSQARRRRHLRRRRRRQRRHLRRRTGAMRYYSAQTPPRESAVGGAQPREENKYGEVYVWPVEH